MTRGAPRAPRGVTHSHLRGRGNGSAAATGQLAQHWPQQRGAGLMWRHCGGRGRRRAAALQLCTLQLQYHVTRSESGWLRDQPLKNADRECYSKK